MTKRLNFLTAMCLMAPALLYAKADDGGGGGGKKSDPSPPPPPENPPAPPETPPGKPTATEQPQTPSPAEQAERQQNETMHPDELKKSDQPKAPEVPLRQPPAKVED